MSPAPSASGWRPGRSGRRRARRGAGRASGAGCAGTERIAAASASTSFTLRPRVEPSERVDDLSRPLRDEQEHTDVESDRPDQLEGPDLHASRPRRRLGVTVVLRGDLEDADRERKQPPAGRDRPAPGDEDEASRPARSPCVTYRSATVSATMAPAEAAAPSAYPSTMTATATITSGPSSRGATVLMARFDQLSPSTEQARAAGDGPREHADLDHRVEARGSRRGSR